MWFLLWLPWNILGTHKGTWEPLIEKHWSRVLLFACKGTVPPSQHPWELTQPVGFLWLCMLGCWGCESTPCPALLGFLKAPQLVGQLVWHVVGAKSEKHVWAAEMSFRPWLWRWQRGPAGSGQLVWVQPLLLDQELGNQRFRSLNPLETLHSSFPVSE